MLLGSRLTAAAEVTAHPAYKQRVVAADETGSVVTFAGNAPLGGAWRVLANGTAAEVRRREDAGLRDYADFADLMAGALTATQCYGQGDIDAGLVSLGPAAAFVQRVEPMQAIFDQMLAEAAAAQARLRGFSAAAG